jgi:phosphocarrier protein HPr
MESRRKQRKSSSIKGDGIMVRKKIVIDNPTGLHLRPAGTFCKAAIQFESKITVLHLRPAGILCKEAMQFQSLITFTFRESTANAKSVLSVLGACIKDRDEIEIICEGEDEEEALQEMIRVVENELI